MRAKDFILNSSISESKIVSMLVGYFKKRGAKLTPQQIEELNNLQLEYNKNEQRIRALEAKARIGRILGDELKDLDDLKITQEMLRQDMVDIGIDAGAQVLKENFADGKVKGKSRPGRVKKAGASCNGSVTSLRKKAKKYSGERGKMYHWCANMKGGKK